MRGGAQKKKLKDQELAHLCSTFCQEQKQEEMKRWKRWSAEIQRARHWTSREEEQAKVMRQQTVTSISKKLKLAQVDWDMATGEDGQFSSGLCPKNRYAFSVQVKVLEGAAASKASVPADKKNRHKPRGH
jgi:hypothetical protein